MATPTATRPTAPIRRWIVRTTIGSFSLAALLGIVALLSAGEFGETEGRILLTTLLVGVVSIAVLCYLTTAGRRSQPVGVAGGVVVLVPLVTGLLLVWADSNGSDDSVVKTFAIGGIVAATLAQTCLLLAPGEAANAVARRMLLGTIGLAAVLAVMTSLLVLGIHPGDDGFYRAVGIVAILDVLGTVVGAALLKFGPGAAGVRNPDGATLSLPPDVAAALSELAARTGRTPDEVGAEILRSQLSAAPSPETAKP